MLCLLRSNKIPKVENRQLWLCVHTAKQLSLAIPNLSGIKDNIWHHPFGPTLGLSSVFGSWIWEGKSIVSILHTSEVQKERPSVGK